MNRNYNILSGALLLLVSGTCFQSCQQDDFGDLQPDIETLVAEGRYITARSVDASELASDTEEPRLFAVGTPYRLLAFTKPYNATDFGNTSNTVNYPRFNKVAWEGETSTGMRFINIDSEPDKWFGFSALALDGEIGGDDNLVSLDFYGFTYGKEAEHPLDYIELDGLSGQTVPADGSLENLSHTESLLTTEDGNTELNDLMRGVLLNQNIQTAGKSDDGNTDNAYTQSIMPFKHCFSKLRFQISQQGDEENPDADGNPTPSFNNLYVDSIKVTGTYGTGKVYLHDGKVELSGDPCVRNLPFKSGFSGHVTIKNTDVGDMIVFPSDGDALTNMADGYDVGLSITVRSTEKKDIENMLVNTGSVDANGNAVIKETTDEAGTKWYSGTIKKDKIIDYYDLTSTDTPLYFKQNTSYMLIITFQKDAVRIITVIPQVEEWLPGEGTEKNPWQEQALGQPQMFDNIVWSDRNLGADHYDPINADFEHSIGYFYQAGRNIPYYPFKRSDFTGDGKQLPTIEDRQRLQHYEDNSTAWGASPYFFFPVVDKKILSIGSPSTWVISDNPQMVIPEVTPTGKYFDFDKNLGQDDDVKWNEDHNNQPVSGEWQIPTSDQFMSVFPSTPHAGNFAFKTGGYNNNPMDWGSDGGKDDAPWIMDESVKTLRVTVPYYNPNEAAPDSKNDDSGFMKAWNILKTNSDPGTTHSELYTKGGPKNNINNDPNGDPEDGYASIYVISREDGSVEYLPDKYNNNNFWIKEWGTIYAIKRVYTSKAYRMRWRVFIAQEGMVNPGYVVEICRYRCTDKDTFDESDYMKYDWEHPAARIYFPVCGLGDHPGTYINYGTECQYATSDPIRNNLTSTVQIKVNGNNTANAYISIVKNVVNRRFGMQIRPVGGINISK